MSRSRFHVSIVGITTAESEKLDKRGANRRLRHRARVALLNDAEVLPELREVSDVWSFAKDGKQNYDRARFSDLLRK